MLKVDISRRHETTHLGRGVMPTKKGKVSFSFLGALYGSIHYIPIRQELKNADV
jgi:hypothetical protein